MKSAVQSSGAPKAIGPYSPAQLIPLTGKEKLLLTAGQIGLDPHAGELVPGGIRAETQRTLENLAALLEAAGLGLKDVVKTTVYLADMQEFAVMNEVYAAYFTSDPPARSTVQVAGLPRGARVEIEAIALGRDS